MFIANLFKSFQTSPPSSPTAYSKLPETDSDAGHSDDVSTGSFTLEKNTHIIQRSRPHYLVWVCQLIFFLISVAALALAYSLPPTDATCVAQLFSYSPALEAVEYHEEDYSGVFHQPSVYRGNPTPELDEHWRKLWDYGGFNVPYDKLYLLNRSTETTWQRTPEEFGGGAAAMLWGYHQLHCLDMVRQATYRDFYEREYNSTPIAFDGPEYIVRMHIDHCIELLRIHMMCHVDVTPYLVKEDETAPIGIRAEFSSHHKCRNFDKVQKWVVDNTAIP